MVTTVLFDLRVILTVLKFHKTQLALPKWENVGNIFKYGLLIIDFLFREKHIECRTGKAQINLCDSIRLCLGSSQQIYIYIYIYIYI